MRQRVEKALKALNIKRSDRVLVSFSGGPDSVALARVLLEMGFDQLILVYFNHQLRSTELLDREQDFVKEFAKQHRIKIIIKKIPVLFCSQKFRCSIEASGHVLRNYLRAHLAKLSGYKIILTGHHYDDQIESCYLQLLRGPVYSLPLTGECVYEGYRICRPFLQISKKDILSYLEVNNQIYSIDESNTVLDYSRNQIRWQLLPFLNSFDSGTNRQVENLFKEVGQLREYLFPKHYLDQIRVFETPYYEYTDIQEPYFLLSPMQQETILFYVLKQIYSCYFPIQTIRTAFENKIDFSYTHIQLINKAILKQKWGSIGHFPKKLSIYYHKKRLFFCLTKRSKNDALKLNSGYQNFYHVKAKSEFLDFIPEEIRSTESYCYLNTSACDELVLRFIKSTDTFTPFSKNTEMRVHDYLSKKGLSKLERDSILCVESKNKILWIQGFSIEKRAIIGCKDMNCVKISIEALTKPREHVVSY